jgi:hypothetical protein
VTYGVQIIKSKLKEHAEAVVIANNAIYCVAYCGVAVIEK